MSVYGMGSMFSSTDEQLKNFVKDGFACIGWRCEDKPELYEILNDIKIGDIILYQISLPRIKSNESKGCWYCNK